MSGVNGEEHESSVSSRAVAGWSDGEPDCGTVLSEVYLYLDLECSEDRRSLIQKHLDDCTGCLREYGIEHEVKALVARCCGDETAPKELRERLRIKLDQLEVQVETREYYLP